MCGLLHDIGRRTGIAAVRHISREQYDFIKDYLERLEYDDYDKLIILCDALGAAPGH